MKKLISIVLCLCLMLAVGSVAASASESTRVISTTVEKLENGDYYVTVVEQDLLGARSTSTSGKKTSTYYSASRVALWAVTVHGDFTYTSGVSSKATHAAATVSIYDGAVSYVSKNAYTSGATAYASAHMKVSGSDVYRTVSLTCDKYGNLS